MKWLLGPTALLLVMMLAVPIAHGGVLWSGIDPIFRVADHQFNVRIEYPSQYDCSIDGDIKVVVKVPKSVDHVFLSESKGNLSGCSQLTHTYFEKSRAKDHITVRVEVRSDEKFPVKVKVDMDGEWVAVAEGDSNSRINTGRIKFDSKSLGSDPALDGIPDDTMQYTYLQ